MFLSDKNINSLLIRANNALSGISYWFKLNNLSLNVAKCNFIVFTTKNKHVSDDITLKIDNMHITRVGHTKFLGVVINEKLTWDNHISLVSNKVSKSIGVLRRIHSKIPDSILQSLYYTLINPYFEYCNVVWATSTTGELEKLFRVQKRTVRLITKSH
jgi:hypothetical protein